MIYMTTVIPNENITDFLMTLVLRLFELDYVAQLRLFSVLHFPIFTD